MEIRASEADRTRTIAALERHTGAGRLSLDEFAARVDAVCAARTLDELGALVGDLPADADPDGGGRRDLLFVFALAVLSLLLLGGFLAVSRG